eukprot:TRINITY_DN21463_c0_g1_i1.p2 TRINITY_DN21463_c0_g1~~TRINITY_DN21463_c0_g1_i1.p2  ORF type:complete len:128 (-),score=16.05 TRINITY_DN21463_c0_g1_i1:146-529(-)
MELCETREPQTSPAQAVSSQDRTVTAGSGPVAAEVEPSKREVQDDCESGVCEVVDSSGWGAGRSPEMLEAPVSPTQAAALLKDAQVKQALTAFGMKPASKCIVETIGGGAFERRVESRCLTSRKKCR